MPMTPPMIAAAAIRHARRAPHELHVTTTPTGSVVIDTERGTLTITAGVAGYPLLTHTRPDGYDHKTVLAEARAVEAIAAWINGDNLPPSNDSENPENEDIDVLYQDLRDAITGGLPAGLDKASHPTATENGQDMVVSGPEGARLIITPRLNAAGTLTGAAWQGRRTDGSSIAGHGSTNAALTAARQWASTLDQKPVITGIEARARREATGATQADLARLMGLAGSNTISRWESGTRAPRDPRTYLAAIIELEGLADDLYQQALTRGKTSGHLTVWDHDHDYWTAVPTAAQQGTPAAMHRVAAARATATLTAQGIPVRITPSRD